MNSIHSAQGPVATGPGRKLPGASWNWNRVIRVFLKPGGTWAGVSRQTKTKANTLLLRFKMNQKQRLLFYGKAKESDF